MRVFHNFNKLILVRIILIARKSMVQVVSIEKVNTTQIIVEMMMRNCSYLQMLMV